MLALTGYKLAQYMASRLAASNAHRLVDCHPDEATPPNGLAKKVDPVELVSGQWIFIEQPFPNARNANFIALKRSNRPQADDAFFFKQPLVLNGQFDSLYNESQFYETIGKKANELAKHLFKIVQYDYANKILILEYRRKSLMFSDFLAHLFNPRHPKYGVMRLEATGQLAVLLKRFKESLCLKKLLPQVTVGTGVDKICITIPAQKDVCFRTYIPWILTLTDADLLRFNDSSIDPVKEFARLLFGKDPASQFVKKEGTLEPNSIQFVLQNEFKKLQEVWETSHLINADAHLNNIIVDVDNNFFFIDWEYASWGDARWDFAGILAGYLSFLRAENPILSTSEVKDHVKRLCKDYFKDDPDKDTNILVSIQYVGLWLLTDYYAWAVSESQSDNSIYQDKFRLGKLCVFDPSQIKTGFGL